MSCNELGESKRKREREKKRTATASLKVERQMTANFVEPVEWINVVDFSLIYPLKMHPFNGFDDMQMSINVKHPNQNQNLKMKTSIYKAHKA